MQWISGLSWRKALILLRWSLIWFGGSEDNGGRRIGPVESKSEKILVYVSKNIVVALYAALALEHRH